jgi:hypothetical protein
MKQAPPAAVRNTPHLIEALATALPATGLVLEVASGSGYHAAHFARAFPRLTWQPSDPDETSRTSIAAYAQDEGLQNLRAPLGLDVMRPWPIAAADAVLCINMIHISPWAATLALFEGAAKILKLSAPLITYGPYILRGDFRGEGNVSFDASLKSRNPAWGLREVDEIEKVAANNGFTLEKITPMPANNLTLVWRKI